MNAGKIKLYVLPSGLYLQGTPVLIADGCLLMDRFTERLSAKLTLRSMDEREITAVTVKLILFDAVGMPCGEEVFHTFRSLKLSRDKEFGGTPFPISERAARSFTAYVTEVTFGDFSVWQNKVPFGAVSKLRTLEHALGGEEMARQFATRYGNDCVYLPTDDKEMWFCTCGAANRADETRCHHCRICDTCVEGQDHHCVWLNQCVGRRNYRFFFSFVVSMPTRTRLILAMLFNARSIVLRALSW